MYHIGIKQEGKNLDKWNDLRDFIVIYKNKLDLLTTRERMFIEMFYGIKNYIVCENGDNDEKIPFIIPWSQAALSEYAELTEPRVSQIIYNGLVKIGAKEIIEKHQSIRRH